MPNNGMTVDALYEAFMDIDEEGLAIDPTPFAEDIFAFFGKDTLGLDELGQQAWAEKYSSYFPTWDPSQVNLASRKRDLDYRDAMNTLKTTQEVTDRVYDTELDTLSTALGMELSKGREMAGKVGLRSGSLESAVQDTIATTGSKAKDFGDRTRIAGQETKDMYNSAMVDATLDFEKTERQEKEEFYDRTMAAIMRLMDTGAFTDPPVLCTCSAAVGGGPSTAVGESGDCLYTDCPSDACGTVNGSVTDPLECMGGTPTTTIDGNMLTGTCEYGSCDFTAGCEQVCTGAGAGVYGGGMMMCIQDCTGAMGGGAGTWGADDFVVALEEQLESSAGCECGGEFKSAAEGFGQIYVCNDCDDGYNTGTCWRTADLYGSCICNCDDTSLYKHGQACEGNC